MQGIRNVTPLNLQGITRGFKGRPFNTIECDPFLSPDPISTSAIDHHQAYRKTDTNTAAVRRLLRAVLHIPLKFSANETRQPDNSYERLKTSTWNAELKYFCRVLLIFPGGESRGMAETQWGCTWMLLKGWGQAIMNMVLIHHPHFVWSIRNHSHRKYAEAWNTKKALKCVVLELPAASVLFHSSVVVSAKDFLPVDSSSSHCHNPANGINTATATESQWKQCEPVSRAIHPSAWWWSIGTTTIPHIAGTCSVKASHFTINAYYAASLSFSLFLFPVLLCFLRTWIFTKNDNKSRQGQYSPFLNLISPPHAWNNS